MPVNENCKCDYKPLFSPDTLADGYEAALLSSMRRLHLVAPIVATVKTLREAYPYTYMRLCYLAKENGDMALYHTINILVDTGFLPDTSKEQGE
jgi:hypothetical protein